MGINLNLEYGKHGIIIPDFETVRDISNALYYLEKAEILEDEITELDNLKKLRRAARDLGVYLYLGTTDVDAAGFFFDFLKEAGIEITFGHDRGYWAKVKRDFNVIRIAEAFLKTLKNYKMRMEGLHENHRND